MASGPDSAHGLRTTPSWVQERSLSGAITQAGRTCLPRVREVRSSGRPGRKSGSDGTRTRAYPRDPFTSPATAMSVRRVEPFPAPARDLAASMTDAPDTDEPAAVLTQFDDLYSTAGMRCVHHPSPANVDADMPEAGEEEHVPGSHFPAWYPTTVVKECVRAVRELDTESPIRVIDKPRAVEAAYRGDAAPAIRHSYFFEGDCRYTLANAGLVCVRCGRVSSRRTSCSIRQWTRAAEEKRGRCERQHWAARGGRQRRKRTTGRRKRGCAALGLFLSIGS